MCRSSCERDSHFKVISIEISCVFVLSRVLQDQFSCDSRSHDLTVVVLDKDGDVIRVFSCTI